MVLEAILPDRLQRQKLTVFAWESDGTQSSQKINSEQFNYEKYRLARDCIDQI